MGSGVCDGYVNCDTGPTRVGQGNLDAVGGSSSNGICRTGAVTVVNARD